MPDTVHSVDGGRRLCFDDRDSSTGKDKEVGLAPHVFLRETKTPDGALGVPPYLYAGAMQYVSHSGDRPVRFTWELAQPLPIDWFQGARLAS